VLVLLTGTSAVTKSNSAPKHEPALRASRSLRPCINSSSNFFTRSASSWSRWSPKRRIRCTNSDGSISLSSDDMMVGDEKLGKTQARSRYESYAQGWE
jgi:hypothetical protein